LFYGNDKAAGILPARLRCRARRHHAAGLFRRYRKIRKGKTDATSPGKESRITGPSAYAAHMEEFAHESKVFNAAVQKRYSADRIGWVPAWPNHR